MNAGEQRGEPAGGAAIGGARSSGLAGGFDRVCAVVAAVLLAALVTALAANVSARGLGLPLVGATLVAQWAFAALAFAALPDLAAPTGAGWRGFAATAVGAFAVATLAAGMAGAAAGVGGTEPVLAIPLAWRYVMAAAFASIALAGALRGPWVALAVGIGAAVALAPLPAAGPLAGAVVFAAALALRVPVALALVAAVAVAPGRLSDAALAQSVMRGLSPYVLLAVPLFILSAALMVAGGVGERMVVAARWFGRRRRSALGEANVIMSTLFGGVSGSSIADAALGARLVVPAMVAAGYPGARAAAITAASAVLPNVLPPSIALLLAAAATNQSVGALWMAGLGAGLVLAIALWLGVRLTPAPDSGAAGEIPTARAALSGLAAPFAIGIGVLGGLRSGLVTSVEAGLLAVALAAAFAFTARGSRAVLAALMEAALQAGRVALLIAAAAPVGFLFATSGPAISDLLPDGSSMTVIAAAALLCLVVGTTLDVGAAILLLLPVLLPAAVAAGADPVHATVALTVALLLGGLTPPVGILVLVVKDITGLRGVYRATLPYLLCLIAGLAALIAVPALTGGLARLF